MHLLTVAADRQADSGAAGALLAEAATCRVAEAGATLVVEEAAIAVVAALMADIDKSKAD